MHSRIPLDAWHRREHRIGDIPLIGISTIIIIITTITITTMIANSIIVGL